METARLLIVGIALGLAVGALLWLVLWLVYRVDSWCYRRATGQAQDRNRATPAPRPTPARRAAPGTRQRAVPHVRPGPPMPVLTPRPPAVYRTAAPHVRSERPGPAVGQPSHGQHSGAAGGTDSAVYPAPGRRLPHCPRLAAAGRAAPRRRPPRRCPLAVLAGVGTGAARRCAVRGAAPALDGSTFCG